MALTALLALALCPLRALAAQGFEEEPFQVSSAVAPSEAPAGGELTLTVTLKLRHDVHLYRDKIGFGWTELKGLAEREVVKPKGKAIPDLNSTEPGATTEAYEGSASVLVKFQVTGAAGEKAVLKGTVGYQGCTDKMCFPPVKFALAAEVPIVAGGPAAPLPKTSTVPGAPATGAVDRPPAARLGWGAILLRLLAALGAGVAIGFTPCVYPMIPVTFAIVGGRGQRSRGQAVALSLLYVLGISLTYATVGVIVATLGGSVQSFLQSVWLRVPIAGIFVLLALSMFDIVTLQGPAGAERLADKVAGAAKGGLGVFLLGVVSGVVVGPCVTPALVGILTYIATTGNCFLGFWMLFAVAWGMGLLLIVAGVSSGFLPKAGKWMGWVKRLMGFVILWGAVYFLSPFVGGAISCLLTAGLILAAVVFLGCLDSLTPESGAGERAKRFLGLVGVFAAAAFFLGGLAGVAQVTGLSAGHGGGVAGQPEAKSILEPGDAAAIEAALQSGKPVLLDFWATWCTVCKELDTRTYSDPAVMQALGRFRTLKIDFDRNPDLVERFHVLGLPTVILFDADGRERKELSFVGYRGPDELLRLLKQVR